MITSAWFGLFLGILLAVYYRIPQKNQWCLLLAASYGFYLWADANCLAFLLLSTLSTFMAGKILEKLPTKQKKRPVVAIWLLGNLGFLTVCKFRFSFYGLALPLGISFYLFQSAGYLLDVYRGTLRAEGNPFRLALFISYFPLLVQGPICKFSQLASQLFAPHPYDKKQFFFGIQRMLWGYFKKLVIADRIAVAVTALRGTDALGVSFWLLSVLYAIQIYGDFTGGIDIALGVSQMFGIGLPENFRRPFFSRSIAEYWRRWHITLGAWMREYIFFPLSISRPLRHLSKAARNRWEHFGRRLPVYAATVVTWFATGIWHGLTPNFVVWGMLNCLVILGSESLSPLYRKFHNRFPWSNTKWYGLFEMLRTFLLMNLIRVCDLFPNVGEYFRRIGSLFTQPWTFPSGLGLAPLDWGILAGGIVLMTAVSILQERRGSVREPLWERKALCWGLTMGLFLAVLLMGCYGIGYDAGNFIYNQF